MEKNDFSCFLGPNRQNIPHFYCFSNFKTRCFTQFKEKNNVAAAEQESAEFLALVYSVRRREYRCPLNGRYLLNADGDEGKKRYLCNNDLKDSY